MRKKLYDVELLSFMICNLIRIRSLISIWIKSFIKIWITTPKDRHYPLELLWEA